MKKRYFVAAALIASIAAAVIWRNMPVQFLRGVLPERIAAVEVFNGSTGRGFTVDNEEDIYYILKNIQTKQLKRRSVSVGYMGYLYRLKFVDKNGKNIEEFIVNSENTIRKDPYFYETEDLCVEYLKLLEERLAE